MRNSAISTKTRMARSHARSSSKSRARSSCGSTRTATAASPLMKSKQALRRRVRRARRNGRGIDFTNNHLCDHRQESFARHCEPPGWRLAMAKKPTQDAGLLEICCAALFRKQSRHRQSSPSTGIGSRVVSSMHQHGPAGLQLNSAPQPAQASRREIGFSNRFVMFLTEALMPGSPLTAIYCATIRQGLSKESAKGNPMARDSHAALVALNRFGFGARGGASGDLVNAASDPRGFVKAELSRPNGVLMEVPGLQSTPALAGAVFAYQLEVQQARAAAAKSSAPTSEAAPPTAGHQPAKTAAAAQRHSEDLSRRGPGTAAARGSRRLRIHRAAGGVLVQPLLHLRQQGRAGADVGGLVRARGDPPGCARTLR